MDDLDKLPPSERIRRLQELKKKQDDDIENKIKEAHNENKENEVSEKRRKDEDNSDEDEKQNKEEDIEEIIQREQIPETKIQPEYKIITQETNMYESKDDLYQTTETHSYDSNKEEQSSYQSKPEENLFEKDDLFKKKDDLFKSNYD